MKTSYSYRRFSSKNQNATSTKRQLEQAEEISLKYGWKLKDLPPDEGLSGYKDDNYHYGALGLFFEKIRAGEIEKGSVLIIEKMDRLSRQSVDIVLPRFFEILRAGVEIYSCIDQQLYTLDSIRTDQSKILIAIIAIQAANSYSRDLSHRIKKTFDMKFAEMKNGKKLTLGPWCPRWITFKDNKFELNEKADILRNIIRMYLDEDLSFYEIARRMNDKKIPTFCRKSVWRQSIVLWICNHPTLLGDVHVRGIELKNYLPAVIDQDTYNRLQLKLELNRKRRGKKSTNIGNLFRGFIYCKQCGGFVNLQTSDKGYYFRCQNARLNLCNVRKMVKVRPFEEMFLQAHYGSFNDILPVEKADNQELDQLRADKIKIEKRISDLLSLDLDMPQLKSKLLELKQSIQELDAEIKAKQAIQSRKQNKNKHLELILENLTKLDDPEIRKQIHNYLKQDIDRIVIDLEKKQYWIVMPGDKIEDLGANTVAFA